MLYFKRLSPGLFESIDMFASNEGRLRDHVGDGGIDLRPYAEVLSVKIDERYFHERPIGSLESLVERKKRAGFPMYMPDFVIDLVTTAPAPTTTRSQIVTGSTVAFVPMLTLFPTFV